MSKFEGNRTDNKGELTNEYKQFIATRIYSERLLTGLNQKDFAKAVGVSNQTFNNLEQGKGSLKIEYLYQIANFCGCDIGYLLGECENRTYVATDICKATGLSEEAVRILIQANSGNKDSFIQWFDELGKESQNKYLVDMQNEEDRYFIRIVDSIITNYIQSLREPYLVRKATISNKKFPINLMVDYGVQIDRINRYEKMEMANTISKAYNDVIKEMVLSADDEGMAIDEAYARRYFNKGDIEKQMQKNGFVVDDTNRGKVRHCITLFMQNLAFERDSKKYMRIDIQEAFSDYMRSNFFEGENNGK